MSNHRQNVPKGKGVLYCFLAAILPIVVTFVGNLTVFPLFLRGVSFEASIWMQMLLEIMFCCVLLVMLLKRLTEPKAFWLRLAPVMVPLIFFLIACPFLQGSVTRSLSDSDVQMPRPSLLLHMWASSLALYWYLWPFFLVVPPCTYLVFRNPRLARYMLTIQAVIVSGLLVAVSVALVYTRTIV